MAAARNPPRAPPRRLANRRRRRSGRIAHPDEAICLPRAGGRRCRSRAGRSTGPASTPSTWMANTSTRVTRSATPAVSAGPSPAGPRSHDLSGRWSSPATAPAQADRSESATYTEQLRSPLPSVGPEQAPGRGRSGLPAEGEPAPKWLRRDGQLRNGCGGTALERLRRNCFGTAAAGGAVSEGCGGYRPGTVAEGPVSKGCVGKGAPGSCSAAEGQGGLIMVGWSCAAG
jgi:hypothetical protein